MKFEVKSNGSDKDIFFIARNKRITFKEAGNRISRSANWLNNKGIRQGSKVALSLSNEWDTSTLFISLLKLGATTILIDPRFKRNKSLATIDRVQPDLLIADEALLKGWGSLKCETVPLSEEVKKNTLSKLLGKKKQSAASENTLDNQLEDSSAVIDFPEVDENNVAYVLFTSGSSAQPKGVNITYKNLFAHIKTLKEVYELDTTSKILNILPIYHTDGIIQGPILSYFTGCGLVRPFDFEISKVQELFDSIYKYRITHFLTVPTMIDILMKFSAGYEDSFKTDDFKHVISSASILEEGLWSSFESKFGVSITNVFGLTETVAGGLFCGPSADSKRIGSIGKPIDCEVKLLKDDGTEISASNEVGELCMRGDHIAKEYLGLGSILNNEGWFSTGDLTYRDCDGFYFIQGRKSNIIISGGVNISPEEIQEVINTCGSVSECYVFGVKDDTWGEKVASAIVPNEKSDSFNLNELKTYLTERLEPNKIPTQFHIVEQIPKTLSGKLDKNALLLLLENSNQNSQTNDVKQSIIQMAATSFNIPTDAVDIYAHSKSIDGWTSLNHLDFIVKIENAFQVKFSTSEIMNVATMHDAIDITTKKLK